MDKQTFFSLIEKYRDGTASDAEKALLEAYYQRLDSAGATGLTDNEEQVLKDAMYTEVMTGIHNNVVPIKRNTWRWTAAAAAVLIMLGAGTWLVFLNKTTNEPGSTAQNTQKPKDLPPGRNAATLTLADGKTIVLDSSSGTISKQGGVTVINVSGMLSYSTNTEAKPVYNTVTTARGNQYQLVLADGSKVWLNSASSLRFPTAFTGAQREVELHGEGYFEVAKNAAQPFIVNITGSRVEVLGTHFNVNCYEDEEAARTTLLEGKVKCVNRESSNVNGQSVILIPGQQAVATHDSRLTIHDNVDIEQVMAWKNGWFEFDNTDLKTIMRQISRWYDVDIIYEQTPPANAKFGGRISRNSNLSNILKGLECDELQFRLEGKKLMVQ